MAEQWFYAFNGQQKGPVDTAALKELARNGAITTASLVWSAGMPSWIPASQVVGLFPSPAPAPLAAQFVATPAPAVVSTPAPVPAPAAATVTAISPQPVMQPTPQNFQPVVMQPAPIQPPQNQPQHGQPMQYNYQQQPAAARSEGVIVGIGNRITDVAQLPSISDVPFAQILTGGLNAGVKEKDIEETFAVGTRLTTPSLAQIDTDWPKPRVFWRVLGAAIALYIMLRLGFTQWHNPLFIPGMIVAGSFAVPFAVLVFFFEMNVTRNVSVYQTGKMLMIGGAISLIAAMVLFGVFQGADPKDFFGAMQVGVVEETAKLVALLIIASQLRFRWQMNGLLFGAAVGAGFGGFETAGYVFVKGLMVSEERMFTILNLRAALAPGMHVAWTAMIGAALWRAKGAQPFNFNMLFSPIVIRTWIIAVVLHGLWDTPFEFLADASGSMWKQYIYCGALTVAAWFVLFGQLKQSLQEVRDAKASASTLELNLNPAMTMMPNSTRAVNPGQQVPM
jgi:protease PrsW